MNPEQADQLVAAVRLLAYSVAFFVAIFTFLFLCGNHGGDK